MFRFVEKMGQVFLFSLDPEKAHAVSLHALKSGALPNPEIVEDTRLQVSVAGLQFSNPLGMAAGYDKNADVPSALFGLGFGHVEVGTVTPLPQPGNPKPRIFRLPKDRGVINRLGFNSLGHQHVAQVLKGQIQADGLLGVNIGANKESNDFAADFVEGIQVFHDLASYLTINISSPNTPGLRALQGTDPLIDLLDRVRSARAKAGEALKKRTPVFLKIAPDLTENEMDNISRALEGSDIDALIVSNTTVSRSKLSDRNRSQEGGLSGRPLHQRSTRVLAKMYQRVDHRIPLIGIGGISDLQTAVAKFEAGAALIQLYTGMIYGGAYLPSKIIKGLSTYLTQNNLNSITELTGTKSVEWANTDEPD